jgi:hypothetical protein
MLKGFVEFLRAREEFKRDQRTHALEVENMDLKDSMEKMFGIVARKLFALERRSSPAHHWTGIDASLVPSRGCQTIREFVDDVETYVDTYLTKIERNVDTLQHTILDMKEGDTNA